jgi:hypothetical protein
MKNKLLFSFHSQTAARGWFFGFALFLCASVSGQNLLKNGSFESPIDPVGSDGTTNWALVYVYGSPADFAYADRTTEGCFPDTNAPTKGSWGAAFRPSHQWFCHAYHKQIVSGLTPGTSYTLSGYMHTGYDNDQMAVYIAMFGGADGSTIVSNRATEFRTQYFMTNTASTSGQIEVRVGLNKKYMTFGIEDPKFVKCEGWFDVFSLTPTP